MKIITNNIEKDCWDLLSIYEDNKFVKEKLLGSFPAIKDSTLNKVSSEINFYVKQANELYVASNNSIISSPLTLFYSLNNLVKAAYLLRNPTKGMSQSHGLSLNSRAEEINKLSDISIHINNSGTFNNLNELLDNNLPRDLDLNLKDLFSIIPELLSLYNIVYKEEANVYMLMKNLDTIYEYKVVLPNNTYKSLEEKCKLLLEKNNVFISFGGNVYGENCYINETCATKDIDNILEYDIYGNRYLTLGLKIGDNFIKIEQLNAIYIILYAFSMEVRYKAYEWINIINSKEKAIVKKVIDDLKVKMLVYILSLIEDDKYEFINKIEDYRNNIDYSDLTDKILKEIKQKNIVKGKSVLNDLI